jgi:hypothetical protein
VATSHAGRTRSIADCVLQIADRRILDFGFFLQIVDCGL